MAKTTEMSQSSGASYTTDQQDLDAIRYEVHTFDSWARSLAAAAIEVATRKNRESPLSDGVMALDNSMTIDLRPLKAFHHVGVCVELEGTAYCITIGAGSTTGPH